MTVLRVVRGDITTVEVDVVVNAANSTLMGGGGVDGAIHRAGGPEILDECRAIVARRGGCATGEAVITGGGALPARHVVHTVGPVWSGRDPELQDAQLASCYRHALDLAAAAGARSVAFPNISTGAYRFPKPRAARVALAAVAQWLDAAPGALEEVVFVCFDGDDAALYGELLDTPPDIL